MSAAPLADDPLIDEILPTAPANRWLRLVAGDVAEWRSLAGEVRQLHPKEFTMPASYCEPTDAQPGSIAKVEVLRGRYKAGQCLWHPLDPHAKDTDEQLANKARRREAL